jgi:hypothetical protein
VHSLLLIQVEGFEFYSCPGSGVSPACIETGLIILHIISENRSGWFLNWP